VRSALFWDITQRRMVIPYLCYGTTCWSHLQEPTNSKENRAWL